MTVIYVSFVRSQLWWA